MRLNIPLCDWITLTTFDNSAVLQAIFVTLSTGLREDARRLQYRGQVTDNVFLGRAVQAGDEHHMLQASGERADAVLALADHDLRCTRLDLQITVQAPYADIADKLFQDLDDTESADWSGRKRKLQIIANDDRLDTVYIGSRQGERLIRVYVKPDANGDPAYWRFECEYKGDAARGVYRALLDSKHSPGSILTHEINRLPAQIPSLRPFRDVLRHKTRKFPIRRVESENDTIAWLERQVEPAIIRLLHSHEHRDTMERILRRWLSNY